MESGSGLDLMSRDVVKDLPPEHWHKLIRPIMLDTAGVRVRLNHSSNFRLISLARRLTHSCCPLRRASCHSVDDARSWGAVSGGHLMDFPILCCLTEES